ncbi:MAG: TIGR02808 family protein [Gammaproteobacteria bacterium]
MSTLESIFWNVLGYSAMPVIFIVGFSCVAAGSLWLLSLGTDKDS